MTNTRHRQMTDTVAPAVPRWRTITFWILLVVLLVLHLGERPQMLGFIVTAFGDVGALATHEMHLFAQGVLAWTIVAGVFANLRSPARQVGAAWVYGLGTVLTFGLFVAFADLPPEVVPIVIAAIGIAMAAFLAHPSSLRAKVTPATQPSVALFGLTAVAAIPLAVYAVGQLRIHVASGSHDEHFEFGHWIVMAALAFLPIALGIVAAAKVSGWRVPLWAAGIMVAALGAGSLGINAVSALGTTEALLAILWGGAFIATGEREEARSRTSGATA